MPPPSVIGGSMKTSHHGDHALTLAETSWESLRQFSWQNILGTTRTRVGDIRRRWELFSN